MRLERIKIINICDKIVLFSLYAVAFFLPISKAIIESFICIAIVFYLIKKFIQREDIAKTDINLAIIVYLAICAVSIFISSNPQISTRAIFGKVLQRLALFLIVTETLNNEKRIRNIMYILFFSSLLLGIDGIYQHFTHKDFIRHRPNFDIPRIYATFPSPSDFGCYLSTLIPLVLVHSSINFRFRWVRALFVSLFILLLTCLMFTVSRGAWLAFAASMIFLSIWTNFFTLVFLLLVIFIIVMYPFFYESVKERLSNFFISSDASIIDRKFIWEAALKMFMSKPWLGVGLGTFMFNFKKFVSPDFPYVAYAHNCYLQMAAEIGIVGLAAFLLILILFFYNGIRALNKYKEKSFSWYVLLGSLAAILGYCVHMAADTSFYSVDLGMLFWYVLGIGVAAEKLLTSLNIE